MRDCLDPQDWGWKLVDGQLIPITTDLEAALEDILPPSAHQTEQLME